MSDPHSTCSAWDDRRVQRIIGNLLRIGVLVAALVVLAGGILLLVRDGRQLMDKRAFAGEPADLREFGGILKRVIALRPRGLIQLGLLLLVATPVARVVFSLVAFAIERDRLYVLITAIVLAVLVFSLLGGGL